MTASEHPAAWSAPLSAAMTASNTLAFFASVIKSGEPWTSVCDEAFASAKADLAALTADRDRLATAHGELLAENAQLTRRARSLEQELGRMQAEHDTAAWQQDAIDHPDPDHV